MRIEISFKEADKKKAVQILEILQGTQVCMALRILESCSQDILRQTAVNFKPTIENVADSFQVFPKI